MRTRAGEAPVLVALLTALGNILRVFRLGFQCVWVEEAYATAMSLRGVPDLIVASLTRDNNPPLYYLLGKAAMPLLGPTALSLRAVSALAGIATIPLMYLAAKEAGGEDVGVFAAAMLAVSQFAIYYSQFARAYALSLMFFTGGLWLYLRWRTSGARRNLALAGLLLLLAVSSHYFSLVPVTVLAMDATLRSGLPRRGKALLLVALPVPFLAGTVHLAMGYGPANLPAYGATPYQLAVGGWIEFFGIAGWLFVPLVVTGLLGSFLVQRRDLAGLLMVTVVVTLLAGLGESVLIPFYPRYWICLLPVVLIWLGDLAKLAFGALEHLLGTGLPLWAKTLGVLGFFGGLQLGSIAEHFILQRYSYADCLPLQ